MTATLSLLPDQESYTTLASAVTLSAGLEGGLGRYRKYIFGGTETVTVQWTLSDDDYQTLMTFYITTIEDGTDAFNIQLIIDTGSLQTYLVNIIPNTFNLAAVQGLTYTVQAQLDVTLQAVNSAADLALVAAYEATHP